MERKIGEIFEFGGEWYQCVKSYSCGKCSLSTTECGSGTKSDLAMEVFGNCSKLRRSDNEHAIFKKLEKVGEPKIRNGKMTQKLRKTEADGCVGCCFWNGENCAIEYDVRYPPEPQPESCYANEIYVEVKQNEEDMEENKLNLKPFDIQKAREGKPVCTRDGRKARIICFDRITNTTNEYTGHLIVLVTNPNGDEQSFYYTEKGNLASEDEYDNHKYDLMMLPEKKEGWIIVSKNATIYDSLEDAKKSFDSDKELCICKVEWEE